MDTVNYLYVNVNQDIWVVPGPPKGALEPTCERFEGVTDAMVEELRHNGWKLTDEVRDHLRELPSESL